MTVANAWTRLEVRLLGTIAYLPRRKRVSSVLRKKEEARGGTRKSHSNRIGGMVAVISMGEAIDGKKIRRF